MFEKWAAAKADFIKAMDGNLIYEFPEKITFSLDQREKKMRINDFIYDLEHLWDNDDLANFICAMKDGFFNNTVLYDYTYNNKVIKKGMKLIKAFKFFEKNKNALTDIQNRASRILQEDKIEGTLCLSVHPLDYLSVSENTYNWRSCHSLDGDYRSGNLSYMVDESTVICYLKSDKDEYLPNFPFKWNSKKWRVLLFFSTDWNMVIAGRQYPFETDVGLKFILANLLPQSGVSKNCFWSPWHDEKLGRLSFSDEKGYFYLNHQYVPIGGELVKVKDLIIDNPGSMQFNDLLKSTCYDFVYAYRHYGASRDPFWGREQGETEPGVTKFLIGGGVPCLRCGKREIEVSESMHCIECEEEYGNLIDDDFGYCACCNRHIYLENAHWIDDDALCDQCYISETATCDRCGDVVYKNNITFDRERNEYVCNDCIYNIEMRREWTYG